MEPPAHKQFLSDSQKNELVEFIRLTEANTSGEIRIHIENHCPADPLERASEVFLKLKMNETSDRTGILIYVATKDRKLAIYGDKGIDELVDAEFWQNISQNVIANFKQGDYFTGLHSALTQVAKVLTQYFPSKGNNKNELSNEISTNHN